NNRCSASTAVWSQSSPLSSSRGSSGSQFFSFFPTKFHFSSNWTSQVRGGKSHQLVVEEFGLVAGPGEVARDGVPGDAGEPAGGADADALAEMAQNGDGLVCGQLGAFQGGAFSLGVGPFASAAVDHADALVAPAPTAEIDVAVAAFAVVRAGGIVAEEVSDAQARCFGHDATPWRVYSRGYDSLRRILLALFVRQDHHRSRSSCSSDRGVSSSSDTTTSSISRSAYLSWARWS